jgi:hypothetical protein
MEDTLEDPLAQEDAKEDSKKSSLEDSPEDEDYSSIFWEGDNFWSGPKDKEGDNF